jgi:AAA+ superfamily predicted ATPase
MPIESLGFEPGTLTADETAAARCAALIAALGRLDQVLQAACDDAERAYGATAGADPYRGFYVAPQDFRRLIGLPPGAPMFRLDPDRGDPRLFADLQRQFDLNDFDVDALLIALAPEIDLRYQRLFAYLQDDVARRRPSIDLVLNLLCPTAETRLRARARFLPDAPLVAGRLLTVSAPAGGSGPFLAREVEVEEAVVSAILGRPVIDRRLQAFASLDLPRAAAPADGKIVDALTAIVERHDGDPDRPCVFYFHGPRHAGQDAAAAALAARLGKPLLSADCRTIVGADIDAPTAGALLLRDARLHDAVLLLEVAAPAAPELHARLRALLGVLRHGLGPIVVSGDVPWAALHGLVDAAPCDVVTVDVTLPDFAERLAIWRDALGPAAASDGELAEVLAGRFRLAAPQIHAAVAAAHGQARLRAAREADRAPAARADDFLAAARGQTTTRLGALARQIRPKFRTRDLILPHDAIAQLDEVCNQVRQRHVVYDRWGFDAKLSVGKGISVLFSGPPGVGKTMAAEVFANELGLDLFKIDLSQIVSKYIGETEKNLDRVFDEARASNAILFFDEADALFGKRSEVRDSHDRYANIEIAYLLQKMDEYEGLSVLATNLKQNLDEAFARRLSFVIDFPFPDEDSRLRIWQSIWPRELPMREDVDLGYVARTFRLSGGSIKNVAVAAAFLAARQGEPVSTAHLVRATRRELQKIGQTLPYGDFGHETVASLTSAAS